MPMYNSVECSHNYSKTSGSLWQYYKDEASDNFADSESFKFKTKITGNTHAHPRAIQQISFAANLDRAKNTTMFLIIEEAKETRNSKSVVNML